MSKITLSLSVIAAAAVVVVGATTAFFNDTETSTGNVFTAGSVDLKIDSFGALYNGATLVIPTEEDIKSPDPLKALDQFLKAHPDFKTQKSSIERINKILAELKTLTPTEEIKRRIQFAETALVLAAYINAKQETKYKVGFFDSKQEVVEKQKMAKQAMQVVTATDFWLTASGDKQQERKNLLEKADILEVGGRNALRRILRRDLEPVAAAAETPQPNKPSAS